MRARFELADVVSLFGATMLAGTRYTPLQLKVLGKISDCRTASLGGEWKEIGHSGQYLYPVHQLSTVYSPHPAKKIC